MNLGSVIASFATGTYVVTRRGPTTVGSDGRADLADPTTITIRASIQPLGGRELQRMSEGMRVTERRGLWTTTLLKVIGNPDVVTIDGEQWEVESLESWGPAIGTYYRAVIAKVGH